MFAHLGEWACARLAGKVARHAGQGDLRTKKRVFGVYLVSGSSDYPLDSSELTDRLAACGARPPVVIEDPNSEQDAVNVAVKMKSEGVTTIFCLCHIIQAKTLGTAVTSQLYFPEWIISTYDLQDNNFVMDLSLPPEQREHLFGLQMVPKQVSAENLPSVWARLEVDPDYDVSSPTTLNEAYRQMLILASGVQMAGPRLTPETFAQGLQRTVFPNPLTPILAGRVGYEGGAHGMTNDAIEYWWSESAPSPYVEGEGNGAMCYVGRKRYRLGEYEKGSDDVFFKPPCDSGASGT